MIDLEALIGRAAAARASDIHLTVGLPPIFRVDGALTDAGETPLTAAETFSAAQELCSPAQLQELEERGEVDFAATFRGKTRMRLNVFRQQGCTALAMRRRSCACPRSWWSRRKSLGGWCWSRDPPAPARAPPWPPF